LTVCVTMKTTMMTTMMPVIWFPSCPAQGHVQQCCACGQGCVE
jgi:hypothetical protein